MGKEFGNSIGDQIFIKTLEGAGVIAGIYEGIKYSEKTQAFVNSLLLGVGDVSTDILGASADRLIDNFLDEEELA